jgi:hypothetical protein
VGDDREGRRRAAAALSVVAHWGAIVRSQARHPFDLQHHGARA